MTRAHSPYHVLSLYPISRGYAFVLFEGPLKPLDWGIREIRSGRKNEATLKSMHVLIKRYQPDRILIEDYTDPKSRRALRIKALYQMIADLAKKEHVELSCISHDMVLACFAPEGVKTKHEIAHAVARQIPALAYKLPPERKIWMSLDPRQGLFDAAALGVVYFSASDLHA